MPIDLITALGRSQLNPNAEAHDPVDFPKIDPRTELGGVLIRLKYGGDRSQEDRALRLLAVWITHQRAFKNWKVSAGGLLDRFVGQALAEWLWQTCEICHGREFVGLKRGEVEERRVRCTRCKGAGRLVEVPADSKFGKAIRRSCNRCCGKGWRTVQIPVTPRKAELCKGCGGTGGRIPNDAERQRALGLRPHVYNRHWIKRFSWVAALFDWVDLSAKRGLQSQLRRRINSP